MTSSSSFLWRAISFGCASARERPSARLRFEAPLATAFKNDTIPSSLIDLLIHISREGVTVREIFRRPGNPSEQRRLIKRLGEGKPIDFSSYNFYTLASVVKKFLLSIPGGVFGLAAEQEMLQVLKVDSLLRKLDIIHKVIVSLPLSTQRFLSLLFGIWFRIVNHSEFHGMTSEAMAKSVTGSIFRNSNDHPIKVNAAAKVMEVLIENFGSPAMFGQENIQYFADTTNSGILVKEMFSYEYRSMGSQDVLQSEGGDTASRYTLFDDVSTTGAPPITVLPSHIKDPNFMKNCISAPEVNQIGKRGPGAARKSTTPSTPTMGGAYSLSKFDTVRSRQIQRMRKRSDWFLLSEKERAAAASGEENSPAMRIGGNNTNNSGTWRGSAYPGGDYGTSDAGSVFTDDQLRDDGVISQSTDVPAYSGFVVRHGGEGHRRGGDPSVGSISSSLTGHDGSITTTKYFVKETVFGPRQLKAS